MKQIFRKISLVGFVLLCVTSCVGTGPGDLITDFGDGSSSTDDTSGPQETPTVESSLSVPDGFNDVHTGLAVRFVEVPQCGTAPCQQIEIYALKRCPSRVYLEANVLDSSKRVIGVTRGELGGLPQGQTGLITFPITNVGAVNVELVEAACT